MMQKPVYQGATLQQTADQGMTLITSIYGSNAMMRNTAVHCSPSHANNERFDNMPQQPVNQGMPKES